MAYGRRSACRRLKRSTHRCQRTMIAIDTNILVCAHQTDSPWRDAAVNVVRPIAEGNEAWAVPWPCIHEFYGVVTHSRFKIPSTPDEALGMIAAISITERASAWRVDHALRATFILGAQRQTNWRNDPRCPHCRDLPASWRDGVVVCGSGLLAVRGFQDAQSPRRGKVGSSFRFFAVFGGRNGAKLKAQENEQAQRHKPDPPRPVRVAQESLSFELFFHATIEADAFTPPKTARNQSSRPRCWRPCCRA